MSADVLRRAAALMRERAEFATSGSWTAATTLHSAPSYASWHPAVALAVADQLDWAAGLLDEAGSGPLAILADGLAAKSLTVARIYLGETEPTA